MISWTVARPSRWAVLGLCAAAAASGGCIPASTVTQTTTQPPASPEVVSEEVADDSVPMNPYTGKPVVFYSMCLNDDGTYSREGPKGVPGKHCKFHRDDVAQPDYSGFGPYFSPSINPGSGDDGQYVHPI